MINLIKNQSGKGGMIIVLLLGLVIFGSVMLTNGPFPQNYETPSENTSGEVILSDDGQVQKYDTLQLKTLKFKQCAKTAAVNFLVDNSGSMQFGSKLQNLKSGLTAFGTGFPDNGAIAMQVFSGPNPPREIIPPSYFKDAKNQFNLGVKSMTAYGATYTRDAFVFAKSKLDIAIPKFPDHKFAMIFISDGIPETIGCSPRQNNCWPADQDPRTSPSVADEIKNEGVRIFTIAYLDRQDAFWDGQLESLMKDVASSQTDYYRAPLTNQLTDILNQIGNKLCKE